MCGFSRVRACPPTNYRRGSPWWFDAFGAETVRRESRHHQSERSTSESACYKKAYNESFSTDFTSDVDVEHRNARRCGMLVTPAARGTLDPSARCRVWQEDCKIEASAPEVSS